MDVFNALQTAVSGLKAQAFSLDNISGNIANAQTTGFRRVDTTFVDMLTEEPARTQTSGSVAAYSQLTNTLQGNLTATGVTTNMALNGDGFFVVRTPGTDTAGQQTFPTGDLYTRRGDFTVDKNGNLVNGAGSYLVGQSLDPLTGQATGDGVIKISNQAVPAKATTTISYAANLPKSPTTTSGSTLLGALAGGDVRVLSGSAATPASVAASDTDSFLSSSISGGSLTAYAADGSPVNLQMRWAKVAAAESGTGTSDTWNLFYASKTGTTAAASTWKNVGTAFTFNGSGQITAPTGGTLAIPGLTVDGTALGTVSLDMSGGLTQYGAASGQITTNTLQQNGYASGSLTALAVTSDGKLTGTYSNGNSLALAQVGVVRFNAPDALKATSGGNYAQTVDSGEPLTGLKGTTIVGGNVEQSNTDTASEFSKMIITQQAYSANTRVMSTAQQMMSDLINIIR